MSRTIVQHARKHLPRCIAGFQIASAPSLLKKVPKSEETAYFALRCRCGSEGSFILGYRVADEADPDGQLFIGPLALECPDCGSVTEMMDPRKDGYDAEIGHCCSMVGEGPRDRFACAKCDGPLMDVVVGLEYGIDEEDLESDENMADHPQDYFTAFALFGRCKSCGAFQDAAQYECA